MHKAQVKRGIKPSWEPLLGLVGKELVTGFMWMHALELDDGAELHAYKVVATRRYLHIAADGRVFAQRGDHRYEQVSAGAALAEAFEGWEDLVPQPRDPDAVRALLERHRSATSQEMH
ncbi:hypothetical protein [Solirubrobacter soli]|uniref:hypothetical protein n=1 Tax=Solirubrobacter soli TaxID=363832 RepID=UPI0003FF6079|nr:hypothetical protein [Solirubrobacter soli]